MYGIRRAADLSGVPADTVRMWERRYGVPKPRRTTSGYRVYSVQDIRLLKRMHELVQDGVAPSRAATLVAETAQALLPTCSPQEFVARIAAGDFPEPELDRLLQAAAAQRAWAEVADEWLMPMLQSLGRAWADDRVTLVQEHAVSAVVMRHLTNAYHRLTATGGPVVLLGLPSGERHEIGVLLFSVMLRAAGVNARYLGVDLDAAHWRTVINEASPAWVISAGYVTESDDPLRRIMAELSRLPGLHIGIGGRAAPGIPEAQQLGPGFGPALSHVLETLTPIRS